MNPIFSIILLLALCNPLAIEAANDIITLDLKLLEVSEDQSIDLNLAMEAKLVGRKESGEPIYQQLLNHGFFQKLGEMRGVNVQNVPRLSVQIGRRGEVKVGQDLRYPKSRNPVDGRIETDQAFLGYEILFVPFAGEGDIAVDVAMKLILREMLTEGELTEKGVKLPQFDEQIIKVRQIVTSGKTVCFGELERRDGRRVMIVGQVMR